MGLRLPYLMTIAAVAAAGLLATECNARRGARVSEPERVARIARGVPLRSFGAVGDGRTDDTAALKKAFAQSNGTCLDGGGLRYKVVGSIRVTGNLCLRNTALVQGAVPIDVSPYIQRRCPITKDPAAVIDCGNPAIPLARAKQIEDSLSIRTLFIRPEPGRGPVSVRLNRVKVDRGPYAEGGARAESAAVWIQGAKGVDLRNLEITGKGKGSGLVVVQAEDVNVDNLWVHDLIWAPYPGDAPLVQSEVARVGWNSIPFQEFRLQGQGGRTESKFYGVRIQEQVTCATFGQVRRVRITRARISRCGAQFDTGFLPFQGDGLDVSRNSEDVQVRDATIDSTWNGMDIVANGSGVDGLVLDNITVTNSFNYGLKFGYWLRNSRISNVEVRDTGLAAIVGGGPIDGLHIRGARISGVGRIAGGDGRLFQPWPAGNRAGFRFDRANAGDARGSPRNVVIEDSTVTSNGPADYEFGLLNTADATAVEVRRFNARGFSKREVQGAGRR